MTVRKMKNGEYDIHLDFKTMYFLRNLLDKWVKDNGEHNPFRPYRQLELLKLMDTALYPDTEIKERSDE